MSWNITSGGNTADSFWDISTVTTYSVNPITGLVTPIAQAPVSYPDPRMTRISGGWKFLCTCGRKYVYQDRLTVLDFAAQHVPKCWAVLRNTNRKESK